MAEVGQILAGRYRLLELLGQGGMATIFRAQDGQLGRDVAVKVLRSEYGRDPAFVARFRQEAQSAAALSHPNVVNVFDYGMEAGDPFIVMELIDGGDLAQAIAQRGAFEPMAAARIGQQIFEALDTAHARGIVHRDIKPTNVLLTSGGRVKVADFGIARAFSEAQLTMPGTTLGSVHYFSPEQARGEMVTTSSDVYSAGLVLFEMLTARRAWTGDSAGAVAVARLAGDPPAPSSIKPGVPPALDVAVRRALARVPTDRPSAGDMAAMLGRYIVDPNASVAFADSNAPAAGAVAAGVATGAAGLAAPPVARAAAAPTGPPPPVRGYGPPGGQYANDPYGTVRRGVPPRNVYEDEVEDPETAGAWGWIAAILGVLVLFAGGVLLFLVLSGRPGTTPGPSASVALIQMPSFVGQPLADAQRNAQTIGFVVTVGAYQQTTDAAEGTIISQDPAAGGLFARGTQVTVTVATQQVTVLVPDLRLRTEPELFTILAQNGLVPGVRSTEFDPTVPPNLIVRTNPRAGIEVARGTAIDYVVSLGAAPTPSPTIPTTAPPPTPSPTASPTATPSPTPTATPTATPTVPPTPTLPPTPTPPPPPTASPTPAPSPVTVGNYTASADLGSAKFEIEQAGLTVGVVWPPDNDDSWVVCAQSPASGDQVDPGTEVHLFVKQPSEAC